MWKRFPFPGKRIFIDCMDKTVCSEKRESFLKFIYLVLLNLPFYKPSTILKTHNTVFTTPVAQHLLNFGGESVFNRVKVVFCFPQFVLALGFCLFLCQLKLVVSLKSKSMSPLIHLKIKIQRCLSSNSQSCPFQQFQTLVAPWALACISPHQLSTHYFIKISQTSTRASITVCIGKCFLFLQCKTNRLHFCVL